MSRRIVYTIMAVVVILSGCKGGNNSNGTAGEPETAISMEQQIKNEAIANAWNQIGDEPVLKISTTDGDMTVKLYSETPLHRDNFIKLAKSGFYNGILFHRIIKGFMIQTGDPLTKDSTQVAHFGTGGPGYTIPAEILPQFTHKKGALAAARRGDSVNPAKESSGSQFYIVQDEGGCKHLDGEYTIFGEVIDGFEVIDVIAAEATDQRDRPYEKVEIISIVPVTE